MEDLRHQQENSSSDEMFSFPGTPSDVGEFEFGCITPSSPFRHDDPDKNTSPSPADQFFLNGRLLPHSFPPADKSSTRNSTSRTSSVSSKDSLMSSRSNSTNSRSSTCSSARTSSSEISERRAQLQQSKLASRTSSRSTRERCGNHNQNKTKNMLGHQAYQFGSSQRWQLISPVPVLGPSRSRRRRSSSMEFGLQGKMSPTKKEDEEKGSEGGSGFVQRFFRSFVKSCKACHAMDMECVVEDDNDLGLFQAKSKSELK